ncbi:hypothetical protein BDR07DRAFT_1301608 [Suillus spraguei]|nr:hypothetical protein BDR07DRAFT_1301608 [Suillus spraguei]
MLCVLNPQKNALIAVRHSLLIVPICSMLFPLSGLTTWTFAITSLVPNVICIRGSWARCGEKEARISFQNYLWYLPVMLVLMMVHKQRIEWGRWVGMEDELPSYGAHIPKP